MHGDSISISVGGRRGNDRAHRDLFHFSDALENVARLPPFRHELMFVIDVLIAAAAATAEIGTLRRDAMGGRLKHFEDFGFGEFLLFAQDLGGNGFAIDREWNKNSLAV